MNPTQNSKHTAPQPKKSNRPAVLIVFQIFLSLLVIGCGLVIAYYYLNNSPKVKPKKRTPSPPLVQVIPLRFESYKYSVEGFGTVISAREIELTAGVAGEVIEMNDNLVPGGSLKKNEQLLTLDPTDYKLAILQLQSEETKARSDLNLEMGNQRISRREFELLGQRVSAAEKELMLRQPQLEIAKANLRAVQAKIALAELDLGRTQVVAPFNSVVLSRTVTSGARITQSVPLARLVGTDQFWVKLSVPVEQLQWITVPSQSGMKGSEVRIFLTSKMGNGTFRMGHVFRLAADLEQQGRMAVIYVEVDDPLALLPENAEKPKLLLSSFVRAEIMGRELSHVVVIDRQYLRDTSSLWLIDTSDKLQIREVEILARSREKIFVAAGVSEGERLVTSGISNPVEGLQLKLMAKDGKRKVATRNEKREAHQ